MCRSIKTLRRPQGSVQQGSVPEEDIYEAALQYIRKISGYRVPSKANREAFDAAVAEVAGASQRLLEGLTVRG